MDDRDMIGEQLDLLGEYDPRFENLSKAWTMAQEFECGPVHEMTIEYVGTVSVEVSQAYLRSYDDNLQAQIAHEADGDAVVREAVDQLRTMDIHPLSAGLLGCALTLSHGIPLGSDLHSRMIKLINEIHDEVVC